jgi:alpha-L-rhamnosidase
MTDCPTREKLGWLEQTHLTGSLIMNNYGVLKLYEKIADDIAAGQLANGFVPAIAPE